MTLHCRFCGGGVEFNGHYKVNVGSDDLHDCAGLRSYQDPATGYHPHTAQRPSQARKGVKRSLVKQNRPPLTG